MLSYYLYFHLIWQNVFYYLFVQLIIVIGYRMYHGKESFLMNTYTVSLQNPDTHSLFITLEQILSQMTFTIHFLIIFLLW